MLLKSQEDSAHKLKGCVPVLLRGWGKFRCVKEGSLQEMPSAASPSGPPKKEQGQC